MEALTKRVRVSNMYSPRGGQVPNQFVIETEEGTYFQSYGSVIAFIPNASNNANLLTVLDANKWDFSSTTGKYRNQFLRVDGKCEVEKRIKEGRYILADLNA